MGDRTDSQTEEYIHNMYSGVPRIPHLSLFVLAFLIWGCVEPQPTYTTAHVWHNYEILQRGEYQAAFSAVVAMAVCSHHRTAAVVFRAAAMLLHPTADVKVTGASPGRSVHHHPISQQITQIVRRYCCFQPAPTQQPFIKAHYFLKAAAARELLGT